jgi:hypothetical protein
MLIYQKYTEADLPLSSDARKHLEQQGKFYFFIHRAKDFVTRSAVLSVFTMVHRITLGKEIPSSLRSEPVIAITGSAQELETINAQMCVHIAHNPNSYEAETEYTDPTSDYSVYGVLPLSETATLLIGLTPDAHEPAFQFNEIFTMYPGDIPNYKLDIPTITDIGKFFANYLLLVQPFGDLIDYINTPMKPGMLDDKVSAFVFQGKITRSQFNKYMALGFWFYEDGSMCLQPLTAKTMVTSDEVLKKRNELFAKYKDNLDDPKVITAIEKELLDMDKAYVKGDPSEPFFTTNPSKGFGDWRKKMFITFGGAPGFENKKVSFTTADESLEEGWKVEHLDVVANDIRRGTYNRHRETAKGGEQTKFVMRIFQNVRIIEDDCGDTRGTEVTITEDNYKLFVDRYVVGKKEPLTTDDLKASIGQTLKIRSPMSCKTVGGHCYKCCGHFYESLKMSKIGPQALSATAAMTSTAMASMHSTTVNTNKVVNLNRFLV